ncbi:DUF488 domain-containing protein [Paraburkholderia phosphatilytica]|uniref:DUF488 domain-containing protein n=1 Tax=Paraburkholderia phosphatilytica TaxID=2282883 RepID=UPI000E4840F7|nr:DUF488 family protein [Paraburkholderia phosphatilytica]
MSRTKKHAAPIQIKRAYDEPAESDGYRALVDRLWPRGRSKATLALDVWAKDLAPSNALRETFCHVVERWNDFQQHYRDELAQPGQQERLKSLLAEAGDQPITLVYGAKDEEHNQAVVLRDVLLELRKG